MKTTIKDVAKAADISITAVSQVLNGKPCRISEEKRELIVRMAKELHYQPNRNAVALATNQTKVIGVILNDISNTYFAEFAKGAQDIATQNGYQILLVNLRNRWGKSVEFARVLGFDNTDGLILTRDIDTPELEQYMNSYYYDRKKPVANAGNGEKMFPCGNIIFDNELGGYIATKHLIDNGHRVIGCLTGHDLTPSSRLNGYKKALEEAGIPYDEELVKSGDYHQEPAELLAKEFYDKGATAIFAFNDLMAYGVYRMAKHNSLKIGEDISVVGFDDLEFSEYLSVPLTSVKQPAYDMGAASCRTLLEMLDNSCQKADNVYFEPVLVQRASVKRLS